MKITLDINETKLARAIAFINAETTDDLKADAFLFSSFRFPVEALAAIFHVQIKEIFALNYSIKDELDGLDPLLSGKVTKLKALLHESQYISGLELAKELGLSPKGISTFIKEEFGVVMPNLASDYEGWLRMNHSDLHTAYFG